MFEEKISVQTSKKTNFCNGSLKSGVKSDTQVCNNEENNEMNIVFSLDE